MLRSAAFLSALLLAAIPARSLDLTGTWEGRFQCDVFDGKTDRFPQPRQIFRISQTGNDVRLEWTDPTQLPEPVVRLVGVALPDAKRPDTKGELVVADCETSSNLAGYAELSRYTARVKPKSGKGSLKGLTIFSPAGAEVGSCKAKFKRVDASDPGVAGCP